MQGTAAAPGWVAVSMEIVREHLEQYRQATGREAKQELIDAFQLDQLEKLYRHLADPKEKYEPMTLQAWEEKHRES